MINQNTKAVNLNNPFWQFSLAVYAKPEVQTLVLAMQDQHGVNVNMVLWAAWLDKQQLRLPENQWQAVEQSIQPWVTNTDEIRSLRRYQKLLVKEFKKNHSSVSEQAENLRARILKLELASEQFQQALLFGYTKKSVDSSDNKAHANLFNLLSNRWQLPQTYFEQAQSLLV